MPRSREQAISHTGVSVVYTSLRQAAQAMCKADLVDYAIKRAEVTIATIELVHCTRKGQFDRVRLGSQDQASVGIWTAGRSA